MNAAHDSLSAITSVFLNSESDFSEIFQAGKNYKELLMLASGLEISAVPDEETIVTESGKAIGPTYASLCVDDIFRTQRFIKGIFQAVEDVRKGGKQNVRLLYAGTGPFATLVLPLTSRFSSEEINFTLLEINEKSFESVKKTFKSLDLDSYVHEYIKGDGTTLKVQEAEQFDILIVEAMTHSLKSEHQVAITYNLLPQIRDDAILIPERIDLNLLGVDINKMAQYKTTGDSSIAYFKNLGNLFTLDREQVKLHKKDFEAAFPKFIFPMKETVIPEDTNEEFTSLSIATDIQVYKDIRLQIDECGLTMLFKLYDLDPMKEIGTTLTTKYICGKHPRLQCRLVD